jgi:hypothetical protein
VYSYGSSFICPPLIFCGGCGSGRDEEPSGGKVLRLIQIRLAMPSLAKSLQRVKPIRRKPESRIPVLQTRSAFRQHARRTAFRRRGGHLQQRLFASARPRLTRSPTPTGFAEIVSDDLPVLHRVLIGASFSKMAHSPACRNST